MLKQHDERESGSEKKSDPEDVADKAHKSHLFYRNSGATAKGYFAAIRASHFCPIAVNRPLGVALPMRADCRADGTRIAVRHCCGVMIR